MIKEMACPECGAGDGIEVFERDGLTVGDSVCCQCGFTIPEGVGLEDYLKNYRDNKKLWEMLV